MSLPDNHEDVLAYMRAHLETDLEREWRERAEQLERDLERMSRRVTAAELRAARAERDLDLVVRAQESARRHRAAKKAGQTSLEVGDLP